MNIIQPFSSRLPQSVRFGGGYGSDSSSDEEDVEALRAKLQKSLQHVARGSDTFQVSSSSRKLEFHRPVSPERRIEPEAPQFQPLSEDAEEVIPIMRGKHDHPLPAAGRVKPPLAAAKDFDLEETAIRQLEEQQKIRENRATAKTQWFQIGLQAIGAATFAAVGLPVLAHPHSVMTTLSIAGSILKPLANMFHLGAELASNPQRKSAAQEMFSGITSFFKRGLRTLGFGGRSDSPRFSGQSLSADAPHPGAKTLRFGMQRGKQTQELTQKTTSGPITRKSLLTRALEASETFLRGLQSARSDQETVTAAQTLQKSAIRTAQDYILAHGSELEKENIRKVQAFQRNLEVLHQAMPEDMDTYEELSKPAQNHLRQMIYDTLTSNLPDLTNWGRQQGRAIGMTEAQIQRVIDRTGSSSRTTSDKR